VSSRHPQIKKAKVVISAVLLLLVSLGLAFADGLEDARRRGKLLVGVKTDFPPFGYLDGSGTIQGFDADLARHFGRKLFDDPLGAELVPVTSGGRIPFLYSGWIDVIIASMTATEERGRVLEFSVPYFTSGSLLLVTKESPVQGLQDLAGRTVAVLAGSVQERDLAQIAPDARRATFEKLPEAVAALRHKRADALAQDDLFVLAAAKANPDLRAAGRAFLPRPYVIAVRKGEARFIDWVNAQLGRMRSDGTFQHLWQTHFGEFEARLFKP
jgi:polar amino acid transport system substrate-binding protein